MNRHERRKLEKVWAEIPNANCKGLCTDSCTIIGMEYVEYVQLTKVSGQKPFFKDGHCGYLIDGRCSVYEVRPTVCRLSGLTHGLPCPYGCVPDRVLSKVEAKGIIRRVRAMSGHTDLYFNATDEEVTKFVEKTIWESAKGVKRISLYWNRIRITALTILEKLLLTFNRIWGKVRSS